MCLFPFRAVDTGLLQTIITTLSDLLNIAVTCIASLIFMFQYSWLMTVIILATAPFLVATSLFFGRWIRVKTQVVQDVLFSDRS